MKTPIEATAACAEALDQQDPLKSFRARFHLPPETIYMDGNSLGLMSHDAESALLDTLETWKTRAVGGWFAEDEPWIDSARRVGERAAPLVGAAPGQVVHTGTTTTNIHALIGSFYRPTGARVKLLADALNFPSDIYALKDQVELRGGDPARDLVLAPSADGRTLDEAEIAGLFDPTIAVAWLPSVLYRSGQLLDIEFLTERAHAAGVLIGFDCCHSAGVVPHDFDLWGVDFAVWCGYKYLNSGPGASAFLYVNRRHFDREPAISGWFGNRAETRFDMSHDFEPEPDAGKWQISAPGILQASILDASLRMIEEAGIERIREKSLRMTEYLIALIDAHLSGPPYGIRIGTPREDRRRGGHVVLERDTAAREICAALIDRGVVPDFRPPKVIRICPAPLYGTYREIWETVDRLKSIIEDLD